jgi:hypothetical protein
MILFVDDNAAVLRRAVEAGAQQIQPPTPKTPSLPR